MKQTYQIIEKAKVLLFKNPYDDGHDILHHFKVWENALIITLYENLYSQVDQDILDIATWWHDFERNQEKVELKKTLIEFQISDETMEKILTVVAQVEGAFGKQTLEESKILYDADKLEYLSIGRWEIMERAYNYDQTNKEKLIEYCVAINNRTEHVLANLHYDISRKKFIERIDRFIKNVARKDDEALIKKTIDLELLSNLIYQTA